MSVPTTRRPATDFDWDRARRWGIYGGLTMAFVAAIGMVESLNQRMIVDPILSLGFLSLLWVPVAMGYAATYEEVKEGMAPPEKGERDLLGGLVTGAIAGLFFAAFIAIGDAVDLGVVLPRVGPALIELLTFGRGVLVGAVLWLVASSLLGMFGGLLHVLSDRGRRIVLNVLLWVFFVAMIEIIVEDIFQALHLTFITDRLYVPNGGVSVGGAAVVAVLVALASYRSRGDAVIRFRTHYSTMEAGERLRFNLVAGGITLVLIVVVPMFLGGLANELLANVGLFLLMALGLNLVVGYAGLLDLGYVAFFAVGAYTTAVLTSPLSPGWAPMLTLDFLTVQGWAVMAIVVAVAGVSGLLVGTPVIRLRGDYLAIVTLGFGEIVRILFLSDFLSPMFGGAQGIRNIPAAEVGSVEINGTDPQLVFYLVVTFVGVAIYMAWRLYHSRIGRAWSALREDEDVAETMGVETTKMKLLAFITGAILASFAGMIFAVKVGSVFPASFKLLVSIIVLVIVIVGGMGSIPGVLIGSLVLIGGLGGPTQPGLLAEFGQYKLLLYGALLVFMMLRRPEGLWPSVQRQRELHQEEVLQDAWLKAAASAGAADEDGPAEEETD